MLHIVSAPTGLNSCKSVLENGDAVLFIGDAVYCARSIHSSSTYVLRSDIEGRGLPIPTDVNPIDYDQFVDLVVEYTSSVTWI